MKKIRWILGTLSALIVVVLALSIPVKAADTPWMPNESQPLSYRQKDIFATETVTISGITVEEVVNDTVSPMITAPIVEAVTFKIYNSTKQEIEMEVQSVNGKLPDLNLIKNHNYIIFAEDSNYRMPNAYVWVRDAKLVDIKQYATTNLYPVVDNLRMYKRVSPVTNPEDDRRVMVNLPVVTSGGAQLFNTNIKFVSDVETITVNTGNKGRIQQTLLEETNYMIVVEHDSYGISSFPIAVKDKSEFYAGRYPYDHSSCALVENLEVVNKRDVHKNDTVITNTNYDEVFKDVYSGINGTTTVKGMNFKDFLVLENKMQKNIAELTGKDYEIYDIKLVNPHRWEVAKLAAGEYELTKIIDDNKRVTQVYELKNNVPEKIEFTQSGNEVTFKTNTMSLYPIIIEYEKEDNPFTDVKIGEYYYKPVLWAVKNGITSGTSETTFSPNAGCTRAQAVTFLWRAAGKPEPSTTVMPFTDVEKGQYYEKAVLWAVENKITSGTSETTFSPNEKCSRAQIVSFLWRTAKKPEPASSVMPFTDVEKGQYYEKAVLWAVGNKITSGTSETTFSPNAECTRGQIVTFIYKALAE